MTVKCEIWKDIVGYQGVFMISSHGRVKSLKRKRVLNDRILKCGVNCVGYRVVTLSYEGKKKFKTLHRIIAIAFMDNPNNKPQINHKDGNKLNNYIDIDNPENSNLEWVTDSENKFHAHATGLIKIPSRIGEKSHNVKLTNDEVYFIKVLLNVGETRQSIADRFDVSRSTIKMIANGNNWSHIELEQSFVQ